MVLGETLKRWELLELGAGPGMAAEKKLGGSGSGSIDNSTPLIRPDHVVDLERPLQRPVLVRHLRSCPLQNLPVQTRGALFDF